VRVTQVDAFTNRPFAGNPAAVCLLDRPANDRWMQLVAREMNLSETAFLHREDDGWRLRWFTPTMEVDLCGHATLASAHVLWEEGRLPATTAAGFYTRSGVLTARRSGDWIEMDFPAEPPLPVPLPEPLRAALRVAGEREVRAVGKNRMDYLVELRSTDDVRALRPDFALLRAVPARGVIVTARSDREEYDFVSRFFASAAGVDEDPVTGSAHCCLAPFWAERLGKSALTGYQASARGGVVRSRHAGKRVVLAGQAVTVLTGELRSTP
jgi:PhzF family phenazine biosynthesis protein